MLTLSGDTSLLQAFDTTNDWGQSPAMARFHFIPAKDTLSQGDQHCL